MKPAWRNRLKRPPKPDLFSYFQTQIDGHINLLIFIEQKSEKVDVFGYVTVQKIIRFLMFSVDTLSHWDSLVSEDAWNIWEFHEFFFGFDWLRGSFWRRHEKKGGGLTLSRHIEPLVWSKLNKNVQKILNSIKYLLVPKRSSFKMTYAETSKWRKIKGVGKMKGFETIICLRSSHKIRDTWKFENTKNHKTY